MSQVLCDETYISAIANAIRSKNGLSQTYKLSEMASAIDNFPGKKMPKLKDFIEGHKYKYKEIATSGISKIRYGIFNYSSAYDSKVTGLTKISIADCEYIDFYAFDNCSNLSYADFPQCNYIGSYAFRSCINLVYTNFPECTSMGSSVFHRCISLKDVKFPKCISIASTAFVDCVSLTSVSFPVCTYIGNSAFDNCTSLISIDFPECISIGTQAFYYCRSLSIANFSKCMDISRYAFVNCQSLKTLNLGTSNCVLRNSDAFTSVPLSTLSICVPASYVDAYKVSTNWSYFSSRIFGV